MTLIPTSSASTKPQSSSGRPLRTLNILSVGLLFAITILPLMIYFSIVPWIYSKERVTEEFHKVLYDSHEQTWFANRFLGHRVLKNPLDLWIVQEILYEVRPDVVVEAGTFEGGSALYYASMMDLIGKGKVVTIDIEKAANLPVHPRIQYLVGSSTSAEILEQVKAAIPYGAKVMVVLDSDHRKDHVLKELQLYHSLVSKDSYLIVEDTNVNGNPVFKAYGPGPGEALAEFMKTAKGFVTDTSRERLFVTFNPKGFLKKVE